MEVFEAVRGRRSVRAFTPEPVSRELLNQLVAAAILAPSAVNEQPWHFTIITNAAVLDDIAASSKACMLEDVAEQPDHFRQTLRAVEDCTLAAENLMLVAHALGLGTCWIGFAQRWLETGEGRAALGFTDGEQAVAPIIVGHPKNSVTAVERRNPRVRWKE
jgi:nitroreductase